MQTRGRLFFGLFLIAVAAYAIHSAIGWKFKAALFPLSVGIPLFILVTAQLFLDWLGIKENARGPSIDLEFAANVTPDVAQRRAIGIFLWIGGFILLVFLSGFPVAVPLFILLYLRLQSRVGWTQTVVLTAAAWGFFYLVFQRLIRLQFEAGLVRDWFGF